MKYSKLLLALASVAAIQAGCSGNGALTIETPDFGISIGNPCSEDDLCQDAGVCAHGICMNADDPCVSVTCDPGILCRDGNCQTDDEKKCGDSICTENEVCREQVCKPLCGSKVCANDELCHENQCVQSCGGKLCGMDETCIEDKCVHNGDCGGIQCEETQICNNNICREPGDCNGAACADNETCDKGICRLPGDCSGLACADNETCHEDICKPIGKCGGIACGENEVCDVNKCRPVGDCAGVQCSETEYCFIHTCLPRVMCNGVLCEGGFICVDDSCQPLDVCINNGLPKCGTECCADTQFCGDRNQCCDNDNTCGQGCCFEGEVCENEVCHKACDAGVARCTQTDGTEICCQPGEICTANQCFTPTTSCVDNYMCDNGQYCDAVTQQCLPQPQGDVCKADPKGGEVQPTLVWHWGVGTLKPASNQHPDHTQVMSAPMAADIDGDGIVEIVFNSWSVGSYQGNGVLRILNGKTGELKHFSDILTDGGSQVAIADIRKDIPGLEIVTCSNNYRITMFNNKGEQLWESKTSYNECGQSGPGIADFNGDGNPEVYSRYNVFNGQTGETIARVACGNTSTAHAACDYTVAADLDNDDLPELVGGNVAYKVDIAGKKLTALYHRTDHIDGYPSIADLDLDGDPEIVSVQANSGHIMAFHHDGTDAWSVHPYLNEGLGTSGGGGPATIANVNNTPYPEITLAGAYAYVVYDHTGKKLWHRSTMDYSSRKTGSSIFDFDGDGKSEAVYADECFLRVYDGETGNTRYCQYNPSGTHWEYPVIADVNDDNAAEIVVGANTIAPSCHTINANSGLDDCVKKIIEANGNKAFTQFSGVRVFSSPNRDWINTRKIYNQHAYSITNVSDDGTIPLKVKNNWSTQNLNNFRLNIQPGATYLPDLEITEVSSPRYCEMTV
ncbi:MAG: VCBS repeat-containing protein, partial [Proteobacteria bacterium]|nr:VCBS repeat-containing protein [Pseudomonadota bacterium]